MGSARRLGNRLVTLAGLGCLAATLLLTSFGVRSVRAEGGDAALMSIDPQLASRLEQAPAATPPAPPTPAPAALRPAQGEPIAPGTPAVEVQPGVIVLNTRGYNYGPPLTELDPEAMRFEASPAAEAR